MLVSGLVSKSSCLHDLFRAVLAVRVMKIGEQVGSELYFVAVFVSFSSFVQFMAKYAKSCLRFPLQKSKRILGLSFPKAHIHFICLAITSRSVEI